MIEDHSASILTDDKPTKVPRMWGPFSTIILTVLMFFGSQIVVAIIVLLYAVVKNWSRGSTQFSINGSIGMQFLVVVIAEALLIAGVYFFLRLRKLSLRSIGLAKPNFGDLGYALLGFLVYIIFYFVVTAIVKAVLPQINLDQQQDIGFKGAHGVGLVLVFVALVVLPPIAEEITFRGFLYSGLKTKWPKIVAALVTSFMFAVVHLEFGNNAPLLWVAAIDTFILSLVLIYLREKRGTLAASMILHGLKNCVAFVVLFIFMVH